MRKSEMAVLALAVAYPDTLDMMLNECGEDFFQDERNRLIYREIRALHPGEHVNFFSLFDILDKRIPSSYWIEIKETLRGIADSQAESVLLETIGRVKRECGRKDILRTVEGVARESVVTDEAVTELEETVSSMRVSRMNHETGDLMEAKDKYDTFRRAGSTGIITGIEKIDREIDCLFFGELVILMSRTFVGKTFLALNIQDAIVGNVHHAVGYFSLEMPAHLIYERMAQIYFGLSRFGVKNGFDTLVHSGFTERYQNVRVFEKIYSVPELKSVIVRHGLRIVFVDFMGLLKASVVGSSYERTTAIIRDLKQMAKDLDICLIVLVQLSRAGGHGEVAVTLDMARESGAIEELGDIIIGLWRKGREKDGLDEMDKYLTVRLLKNKRGIGATEICLSDPVTGKITKADNPPPEDRKMEAINSSLAREMSDSIRFAADEKERLILRNPDPRERLRLMRELVSLLRNFKVGDRP